MIVYRASRGTLCGVSLLTTALLLTGCFDPKSDDKRGYTKAPLEHAGWVVKGEQQTAMNKIGAPNQTRADVIEVADAPKAVTGPVKPAVLAPGVTQAMVDDGRKLFSTNTCVGCHGAEGAGTALAPQLSDKTWLNMNGDYDAIVTTITNGVAVPKQHPAPMPPMGGSALTAEQVKSVAAYIYSISH
ncbi:MAG: cytochrome c [Longimicrobiales bacterium]